jgi:hypothetical protein
MASSTLYFPDHQEQLNGAIEEWHQQWNTLSLEEDTSRVKTNWVVTVGRWIPYTSQNEAHLLGETPFPVFDSHMERQDWLRWKEDLSREWGEPRESRLVEYEKYGSTLVLLPNGKQFVQKKDILWGGRLGEHVFLTQERSWEIRNERFPVEQYFVQRTDVRQYAWFKQNQIQCLFRECLEENGTHWFSASLVYPVGTFLGQDWKKWMDTCPLEGMHPRCAIQPFWGNYELQINQGLPFMAYHFS